MAAKKLPESDVFMDSKFMTELQTEEPVFLRVELKEKDEVPYLVALGDPDGGLWFSEEDLRVLIRGLELLIERRAAG